MSSKSDSKPGAKPSPAKRKKTPSAAARKRHAARNRNIGIAAGLGAVTAVVGAAWFGVFGPLFRAPEEDGEHAAPDLAPDAPTPGTHRAPDAFRPDPTAPVPASERDALRPATGPAPTLAEDRGGMANQTGSGNA